MINDEIIKHVNIAWKRLTCRHDYKTLDNSRYKIAGNDNEAIGEVTIIHKKCKKCGYERLTPLDRVYYDR